MSVTRPQVEAHLKLVQDLDLPYELFGLLSDEPRLEAYGRAVLRAVADRPGARVVCYGPGALLWSMTAAAAGATVVVAEPGAYFAPLIREVVGDNGLSERIDVSQGGLAELPSTWRRGVDVVVLDGLDSGLLGRGLLASARWARAELLAPGGALIPRGACLYAAPGELFLGTQCGFDLSAVDDYRGVGPNEPTDLVAQGWRKLAEPRAVASLDFGRGGETVGETVEFATEGPGTLNTLASWYALDLDGSARLDNAPTPDEPRRAQAVAFFEEPVKVDAGETLSFGTALSGNTGLSFSAVGRGRLRSYGRVRPTLPIWHFPMIADVGRNEGFGGAIERALAERPGARVLDIGAGSGLLALVAARAGAERVTACELVPHVAEMARRSVERNDAELGPSATVDIVARASYDLCVPEHMAERASLLVSETVDEGLLGEGFLGALAQARDALLTADAQVIPSAATVYATPIDLHTGRVRGFDLRAVDRLRLGHYTGLQLTETPHALLAEPQAVHRFDFQSGHAEPTQKRFDVPITRAGVCSGVALWFELQLDAECTLSTAPGAGITAWNQAIVFFDQTIEVSVGQTLPIWCDHDLERFSVYPDPAFVEEVLHRTWPVRRAIWAMGLRAGAANRPDASAALCRLLRASEPERLEDIWRELSADDPQQAWLRRDLLADLYAQAGHDL